VNVCSFTYLFIYLFILNIFEELADAHQVLCVSAPEDSVTNVTQPSELRSIHGEDNTCGANVRIGSANKQRQNEINKARPQLNRGRLLDRSAHE
jgi:hypothetical protein